MEQEVGTGLAERERIELELEAGVDQVFALCLDNNPGERRHAQVATGECDGI